MYRNWVFAMREPQIFLAKLFNQTFFATLMVMVYHGVGKTHSESNLNNMSGAIWFLASGQILGYYFGAMLIF
jgi:hypothetical protein